MLALPILQSLGSQENGRKCHGLITSQDDTHNTNVTCILKEVGHNKHCYVAFR